MNDPQYIPVGVVTGTHTLVSRQDQIQVSEQQVDDFDEVPLDIDAFRGTGFSVVVPIERVFDIIERPDFVAAVQQKLVDYYRESGFVQLDAGQPK